MSKYRQIHTAIWNDDKFPFCSDDTKLVFLHILTTPMGNPIGLYKCPIEALAAEMRWDLERYKKAFDEAVSLGFVKYDPRNLVVYIPKFLTYNPPKGPNQAKSWAKVLRDVPNSPLKDEFMEALRENIFRISNAIMNAILNAISMPSAMPSQCHQACHLDGIKCTTLPSDAGPSSPDASYMGSSSITLDSGYTDSSDTLPSSSLEEEKEKNRRMPSREDRGRMGKERGGLQGGERKGKEGERGMGINDLALFEEKDEKNDVSHDVHRAQLVACCSDDVFIKIPITGKTASNGQEAEFAITESMVLEWERLFPSVDVRSKLKQIRAWNLANPMRRKTERGVLRHVVTWLGKEQDRGRLGTNGKTYAMSLEEWARMEDENDAARND